MGKCRHSWDELGFVNEVKEGMKILDRMKSGFLDELGAIRRIMMLGASETDARKLINAVKFGE